MSFLSHIFSRKNHTESSDNSPNVRAALALMKASETGKRASDFLKKRNISLTQDDLPSQTAYFPQKNTLSIDSRLSPADIAVVLTGAARRIEHSDLISRTELTEMKCADGLKYVRAVEADAQAHEAMMYYDLAAVKLPGFIPAPVNTPALLAVSIGKSAGQSEQDTLKNAVIAFYNDDISLKKADGKYIQEMMSGAIKYIHHKKQTAFSKNADGAVFDKICSTDGKAYMPEGFFMRPQSNFVLPQIRQEIDYQAKRYAQFARTKPDTSITTSKSRAEAFAAAMQAAKAGKADQR